MSDSQLEVDACQGVRYLQSFYVKESLRLSELSGSDDNAIDQVLIHKIQRKLEDKCVDLGYVEKGSVSLLSRSIGKVNTSHFNGEIYYHVKIQALIWRPHENQLLTAQVIGKNNIGVYAIYGPPSAPQAFQVVVPKVQPGDDAKFATIELNKPLTFQVVNFKFSLNDAHIKLIGRLIE